MTHGAASGRITVHVLNTALGRPAAGLAITLDRIEGENRARLGAWITNADGRSDGPLVAGNAMQAGIYEVRFEVGAWERASQAEPGFYDTIPIRFRVTEPNAHHHIPLLLAPFGYTTYRGS